MGFKWKQNGNLRFYHWRDVSRFGRPAYHLSADVPMCDSLTELVTLLADNPTPRGQSVMCSASLCKIRDFHRGAKPTQIQVFDSARFQHNPLLDADIEVQPGSISFSTRGLTKFQIALDDMRKGNGDWAMCGHDKQQLWFWWWT
ncbi:unnamed protein product [Phaeothamnion confervicola]